MIDPFRILGPLAGLIGLVGCAAQPVATAPSSAPGDPPPAETRPQPALTAPPVPVDHALPAAPDEANWVTVIAERSEPVSGMSMGGGRLFATYLKDVTTRAYVHALDGTLEREIVLPGIGTAGGFEGEHDATAVYYSFTSFTAPITVYRYDIASGVSTPSGPSNSGTSQRPLESVRSRGRR